MHLSWPRRHFYSREALTSNQCGTLFAYCPTASQNGDQIACKQLRAQASWGMLLRGRHEGGKAALQAVMYTELHSWCGRALVTGVLQEGASADARSECVWQGMSSHYANWGCITSFSVPSKDLLCGIMPHQTRYRWGPEDGFDVILSQDLLGVAWSRSWP